MSTRRFTFVFSVPHITIDVEMPDDCEEGSDDYEAILNRAASSIDVEDHSVEWEDAFPAEDEE